MGEAYLSLNLSFFLQVFENHGEESRLPICAFRREEKPERELIVIGSVGRSTAVCENCLALLIIHNRYHHLNLERLIIQLSTK